MEKIESLLLENVNEFGRFARKRLGDPELAAELYAGFRAGADIKAGRSRR